MGQDTGSGELCALSLPFADLPKKLFRRRLTPSAPLPHTQMHTILARDSRPNQVDDDRFCAYSRAMINIAPLGRPRVACLASLTNCARPQGYILRTYEFPPEEGGAYRREMCRDGREGGQGILDGTSGFALWQGLRASTAAPLYVEGYVHSKRLFLQDGALCR